MSKNQTQATSTLEELAKGAPKKVQDRFKEQSEQGVVNPIVLAALLGVKPQMIYNYLRKGKFSEVEGALGYNSTQKKVIRLDEANTFAQGYVTRKVEREQAKADKIAEELQATEA